MHYNLRPPDARQSISTLITTPCQVWSRWTYPLPYYSVLLLKHYFTLWPWPLTLKICSVSSVTWWNSPPNLNTIEQSGAELLRFQYLTFIYMTLKHVLRVSLGSGIIRQLIDPFLNYSVLCWYVMSRCDLDLWPLDRGVLIKKRNKTKFGSVYKGLPTYRAA